MHQLEWKPGSYGKGVVYPDGNVHTWVIDGPYGSPHHAEMVQGDISYTPQVHRQFHAFDIQPDGSFGISFLSDDKHFALDAVQAADPRLHPSDDHSDDWSFEGKTSSQYADELKAHLDGIGQKNDVAPTPHHETPADTVRNLALDSEEVSAEILSDMSSPEEKKTAQESKVFSRRPGINMNVCVSNPKTPANAVILNDANLQDPETDENKNEWERLKREWYDRNDGQGIPEKQDAEPYGRDHRYNPGNPHSAGVAPPSINWHGPEDDGHYMQGDHSFFYLPEANEIHIGSPVFHHYDIADSMGLDQEDYYEDQGAIVGSVNGENVNMDTRVPEAIRNHIATGLGLPEQEPPEDWRLGAAEEQGNFPNLEGMLPEHVVPEYVETTSYIDDVHDYDSWPVIFDSDRNKLYVGDLGAYHWDLVASHPDLSMYPTNERNEDSDGEWASGPGYAPGNIKPDNHTMGRIDDMSLYNDNDYKLTWYSSGGKPFDLTKAEEQEEESEFTEDWELPAQTPQPQAQPDPWGSQQNLFSKKAAKPKVVEMDTEYPEDNFWHRRPWAYHEDSNTVYLGAPGMLHWHLDEDLNEKEDIWREGVQWGSVNLLDEHVEGDQGGSPHKERYGQPGEITALSDLNLKPGYGDRVKPEYVAPTHAFEALKEHMGEGYHYSLPEEEEDWNFGPTQWTASTNEPNIVELDNIKQISFNDGYENRRPFKYHVPTNTVYMGPPGTHHGQFDEDENYPHDPWAADNDTLDGATGKATVWWRNYREDKNEFDHILHHVNEKYGEEGSEALVDGGAGEWRLAKTAEQMELFDNGLPQVIRTEGGSYHGIGHPFYYLPDHDTVLLGPPGGWHNSISHPLLRETVDTAVHGRVAPDKIIFYDHNFLPDWEEEHKGRVRDALAQEKEIYDPEGEHTWDQVDDNDAIDQWDFNAAAKTAAMTQKKKNEWKEELEGEYGQDQSLTIHEFDDGWSIKYPRTYGDLHREGEIMSNCLSGDKDVSVWGDMWEDYNGEVGTPHPYNPWPDPKSVADQPMDNSPYYSLRDPDNLPVASFAMWEPPNGQSHINEVFGRHNDDPKDEHWDRLQQFADHHDYHLSRPEYPTRCPGCGLVGDDIWRESENDHNVECHNCGHEEYKRDHLSKRTSQSQEGHVDNSSQLDNTNKTKTASPSDSPQTNLTQPVQDHQIEHTPGQRGKGFVTPDGQIHTWDTYEPDHIDPTHQQVVDHRFPGATKRMDKEYKETPYSFFYINENNNIGGWYDEDIQHEELLAQNGLHKAEDEDWVLGKTASEITVQEHDWEVLEAYSMYRRPFLFEEATNTIHVGPLGAYHFDIVSRLEATEGRDVPYINTGELNKSGDGLSVYPLNNLRQNPRCDEICQKLVEHFPNATYKSPSEEQDDWNLAKTSAIEPWDKGSWGKGIMYDDGRLTTWKTDQRGAPHHYAIDQGWEKNAIPLVIHQNGAVDGQWEYDPKWGVDPIELGDVPKRLKEHHPELYVHEQEDWSLFKNSADKRQHTLSDGNTEMVNPKYDAVVTYTHHWQDERTEDEVREEYEYMKDDPERQEKAIQDAIARGKEQMASGEKVLSAHARLDLAMKAAQDFQARGYKNVRAERINDGVRTSRHADNGQKLYHVSPASNRESIEKQGLVPRSDDSDGERPVAVYFFGSLPEAQALAQNNAEDYDIYEVENHPVEAIGYGADPWYRSRQPVPPERVRRVSNKGESNVPKTQGNVGHSMAREEEAAQGKSGLPSKAGLLPSNQREDHHESGIGSDTGPVQLSTCIAYPAPNRRQPSHTHVRENKSKTEKKPSNWKKVKRYLSSLVYGSTDTHTKDSHTLSGPHLSVTYHSDTHPSPAYTTHSQPSTRIESKGGGESRRIGSIMLSGDRGVQPPPKFTSHFYKAGSGHTLDWKPGTWGKGFKRPDGTYRTWPVSDGALHEPTHNEIIESEGFNAEWQIPYSDHFSIAPDGTCPGMEPELYQLDPNIKDDDGEDWKLSNRGPNEAHRDGSHLPARKFAHHFSNSDIQIKRSDEGSIEYETAIIWQPSSQTLYMGGESAKHHSDVLKKFGLEYVPASQEFFQGIFDPKGHPKLWWYDHPGDSDEALIAARLGIGTVEPYEDWHLSNSNPLEGWGPSAPRSTTEEAWEPETGTLDAYRGGGCHILATAIKELNPDWQIAAAYEAGGGYEPMLNNHVVAWNPGTGRAFDAEGWHESPHAALKGYNPNKINLDAQPRLDFSKHKEALEKAKEAFKRHSSTGKVSSSPYETGDYEVPPGLEAPKMGQPWKGLLGHDGRTWAWHTPTGPDWDGRPGHYDVINNVLHQHDGSTQEDFADFYHGYAWTDADEKSDWNLSNVRVGTDWTDPEFIHHDYEFRGQKWPNNRNPLIYDAETHTVHVGLPGTHHWGLSKEAEVQTSAPNHMGYKVPGQNAVWWNTYTEGEEVEPHPQLAWATDRHFKQERQEQAPEDWNLKQGVATQLPPNALTPPGFNPPQPNQPWKGVQVKDGRIYAWAVDQMGEPHHSMFPFQQLDIYHDEVSAYLHEDDNPWPDPTKLLDARDEFGMGGGYHPLTAKTGTLEDSSSEVRIRQLPKVKNEVRTPWEDNRVPVMWYPGRDPHTVHVGVEGDHHIDLFKHIEPLGIPTLNEFKAGNYYPKSNTFAWTSLGDWGRAEVPPHIDKAVRDHFGADSPDNEDWRLSMKRDDYAWGNEVDLGPWEKGQEPQPETSFSYHDPGYTDSMEDFGDRTPYAYHPETNHFFIGTPGMYHATLHNVIINDLAPNGFPEPEDLAYGGIHHEEGGWGDEGEINSLSDFGDSMENWGDKPEIPGRARAALEQHLGEPYKWWGSNEDWRLSKTASEWTIVDDQEPIEENKHHYNWRWFDGRRGIVSDNANKKIVIGPPNDHHHEILNRHGIPYKYDTVGTGTYLPQEKRIVPGNMPADGVAALHQHLGIKPEKEEDWKLSSTEPIEVAREGWGKSQEHGMGHAFVLERGDDGLTLYLGEPGSYHHSLPGYGQSGRVDKDSITFYPSSPEWTTELKAAVREVLLKEDIQNNETGSFDWRGNPFETETDWTLSKTANILPPWQKGSWGKGIITPQGTITAWSVNGQDGLPSHVQAYEMITGRDYFKDWRKSEEGRWPRPKAPQFFAISPEGELKQYGVSQLATNEKELERIRQQLGLEAPAPEEDWSFTPRTATNFKETWIPDSPDGTENNDKPSAKVLSFIYVKETDTVHTGENHWGIAMAVSGMDADNAWDDWMPMRPYGWIDLAHVGAGQVRWGSERDEQVEAAICQRFGVEPEKEEDWTLSKTANESWQPGTEGKGILYGDGRVRTWPIDETGGPHHSEVDHEGAFNNAENVCIGIYENGSVITHGHDPDALEHMQPQLQAHHPELKFEELYDWSL